jgi:hypothetical protein
MKTVRRAGLLSVTTLLGLFAVVSPAGAVPSLGVGVGMDDAFASQQNLPGVISILNDSTAPDTGGTLTLVDIFLSPACDAPSTSTTCGAHFLPGVASVHPTAVGKAGTACAASTFDVNGSPGDPDGYGFLPADNSNDFVQLAPGQLCQILFRWDALQQAPSGVPTFASAYIGGVTDINAGVTGAGSTAYLITACCPGSTPPLGSSALTAFPYGPPNTATKKCKKRRKLRRGKCVKKKHKKRRKTSRR